MIQFLIMLSPMLWGARFPQAAEAFETPPLTTTARRFRAIAFCLFMLAAALLLTAALVDTVANDRELSEKFGSCGIACLNLCIYCSLRYKAANERAFNQIVDSDEPMQNETRHHTDEPE